MSLSQVTSIASTHVDDEGGVGLLQFSLQPQEVLVPPADLVLAGVKVSTCGLGGQRSSYRREGDRLCNSTDVLSFKWYQRCIFLDLSSIYKRHLLTNVNISL